MQNFYFNTNQTLLNKAFLLISTTFYLINISYKYTLMSKTFIPTSTRSY